MPFLHDSDAYLGVVMILQAIDPPCGYNTCSNSKSFYLKMMNEQTLSIYYNSIIPKEYTNAVFLNHFDIPQLFFTQLVPVEDYFLVIQWVSRLLTGQPATGTLPAITQ